MYTYGYLREAILAHLDLDRDEAIAMDIESRFYILSNEAMQAICSGKPDYKFFNVTTVEEFDPVVVDKTNTQIWTVREPTESELDYYNTYGTWPTNIISASSTETANYFKQKDIYLVNTKTPMPKDFIAFSNKQSYKDNDKTTLQELFIRGYSDKSLPSKIKVDYNKDITMMSNSIVFHTANTFYIPYRAVWYMFTSDLSDKDIIDMPIDIFACIPLYVASILLQIDYPQKAQIKRHEFELALARVTVLDTLENNSVPVSFV